MNIIFNESTGITPVYFDEELGLVPSICEHCDGEGNITIWITEDHDKTVKCSFCTPVHDVDMTGACGTNDR